MRNIKDKLAFFADGSMAGSVSTVLWDGPVAAWGKKAFACGPGNDISGGYMGMQPAYSSLAAGIKALQGFASVPEDVLGVMDRLWRGGFGVWLVGGALRDFLMGRPTKDWDLATTATPEQVSEIFPKVIPVGIRFGTVLVHLRDRDIEVSTCSSSGGIIADLNRRDFTVNAFGLAYPDGRFLDLNRGIEDLASGTLRCVGSARRRFREDPLRVLRACRFVSVFGFRIHPAVREGMKYEAEGLRGTAPERIRDEMMKALLGKHVVRSFETMRRCGVLGIVLPELLEGYGRRRGRSRPLDVFHETLYTVRNCAVRPRVRLAALFHRLGRPSARHPCHGRATQRDRPGETCRVATQVMQRWRMSRKEIREVSVLVESQSAVQEPGNVEVRLRRLYGGLGADLLEDLMELARAGFALHMPRDLLFQKMQRLQQVFARVIREKRLTGVRDLAIGGEDVMKALGLPPGPLVGRILSNLYGKVLDDPAMNNYERLMELLEVNSREMLTEIQVEGDLNAGRAGFEDVGRIG